MKTHPLDTLVLATENPGKLEEFRKLLAGAGSIRLLSLAELGVSGKMLEAVETFHTYSENALAKARAVHQATGLPALADDSGLEVDALQGRPGVRSHRYAPTPPRSASMTQDEANRRLLLKELATFPGPRTARFQTVLALSLGNEELTATGTLEGTLVEIPRGENGFGYDSLFQPAETTHTLAELSATEKNRLSHRARAVDVLIETLRKKHLLQGVSG